MLRTLYRAMSYARSLTVQKSKALFSFDYLSRAIDLSDGRDIIVYSRYFPFMFNLPSLPYTTIALTGKETPTRRACSGPSDSCIMWLNGYVRYSSRHRRIRFFIRRPCERIAREREARMLLCHLRPHGSSSHRMLGVEEGEMLLSPTYSPDAARLLHSVSARTWWRRRRSRWQTWSRASLPPSTRKR